MEINQYTNLTKKKPNKNKPRTRPLPKAKQNYLEAEETLHQELSNLLIGYERKFQPTHTKNWRFDFHIVKLRLLIEIEGGSWSGGRSGKLANKAWSVYRYDQTEELGYKIERFHPDQILSGYVINLIQGQLERLENGTDQTISTD
jgi:very-short-patch-repair endonuclease